MSQAAADGAPITNLGMRDEGHCLMDKGCMVGDGLTVFDLAVPNHRSNSQAAGIRNVEPAEFGKLIQIDDGGWLGQTKIHDRDETLAAGQQFGVGAMKTHHFQGYRQR